MSLVLAEEVPLARSLFSQSNTERPRPAASRAMPAPLMPPPTTTMSSTWAMRDRPASPVQPLFRGSTSAFRVDPARRPAFLLSGQHKGGVRRLATANFQFRTFPNKSLESEAFAAGRTAVFCHSRSEEHTSELQS